MPAQVTQVPAELYFKHNDVSIFHAYKDNDIDSGSLRYSFVLDEWDDCYTSIDVRYIKGWKEPKHPPFLIGKDKTKKNEDRWKKYHENRNEEKHIKKFLIECIDRGIELKYI